MFNLIRRDFIIQKRQLLMYILLVLFFVLLGRQDPAFIFLLASIIIPVNTIAYDEKPETNILMNSLPYTRNEIIASRFLGTIVFIILATGVTSILMYVFNRPFSTTDIAISSSLALLLLSLYLPMSYIIKPGYSAPTALTSFLVLAGIVPPIVSYLGERLTSVTNFLLNLSVPIFYTSALLLGIAFYCTSWGVTSFIYRRKAF
ncbi:multidrug ABC transporter permease [Terribacillus saccharophilus]|uniref:Multidrug ABC transporter permease n=1 Tax=Terribacillus saccharophilus TaxID=361277 RepID=A0A075LJV6_9BACI|nr:MULTISPECIES: ABC-2 transporter permease [Terribacillus]AIF67030.1 multidrug ABC transporter permease [Terribacillus goriensis]MCM3224213.1 ABC-2 transporter permease [Terribacillus saccharophilus]